MPQRKTFAEDPSTSSEVALWKANSDAKTNTLKLTGLLQIPKTFFSYADVNGVPWVDTEEGKAAPELYTYVVEKYKPLRPLWLCRWDWEKDGAEEPAKDDMFVDVFACTLAAY